MGDGESPSNLKHQAVLELIALLLIPTLLIDAISRIARARNNAGAVSAEEGARFDPGEDSLWVTGVVRLDCSRCVPPGSEGAAEGSTSCFGTGGSSTIRVPLKRAPHR